MQITFRPLDVTRDDDIGATVAWVNDPEIRHLHLHCPDEAASRRLENLESARAHLTRALDRGARIELILADGAVVGQVELEIDAAPLHGKTPGSAWLGLVVGVREMRGRGIGTAAMDHVESVARAAGCVRAEVGVFEFNHGARRLYQRCGYVELARLPDFTWWDGRPWTDLRLEKAL